MLGQKWIKDVAYNLNHELLHEYFRMWTAIRSAQLDLQDDQEDEIIWILEGSGKYSASSAYNIQFVGQVISNFPKLVWRAWAPPQCKVFLWLLLKDQLWTTARLQVRGLENNYFYALCERNPETYTHLFICPYSREIWDMAATWSGCANLAPATGRYKMKLKIGSVA